MLELALKIGPKDSHVYGAATVVIFYALLKNGRARLRPSTPPRENNLALLLCTYPTMNVLYCAPVQSL